MGKELRNPAEGLHVGVNAMDTYLKGLTRMRVLSREDLQDGRIKFVSTPDGQLTVTAEVTVLGPANDLRPQEESK